MTQEYIPEIRKITPLTFKVDLTPLGPKENPITHRRQTLIERMVRHRFTAITTEPVNFTTHPANSPYAAYKRAWFGLGKKARYVPTFGHPIKKDLSIQTSYVLAHPAILFSNRFHSLVLAEFDTRNRFPAIIEVT